VGGNAGQAGLLPGSYRGKVDHWGDLAREHNALFITLQESHLHPGVLDAEVNITNYNVHRTDRKRRKNGGVISYIRKDISVKEELSHSNSFCEISAQNMPKLRLCLVNIYRPPNCPTVHFQDTLVQLETFLQGLEGEQGMPCILLTGDLNLPFLRDWSSSALETFCSRVAERENSSRSTADDQRQAVMLIHLSQRFYMEQMVRENTRQNNLLDLVFCSDSNLIINHNQIINNQSFSDHNSIVVTLSLGLKHLEANQRINHSLTTIPEYDIKSGDEEDWLRMNMLLSKINWEEELKGLTVQEITDKLMLELETNVKLIFKKYDKNAKEEETEVEKVESNNKIPKNIRKLFNQKRSATKRIFKSTSAKKCLALKIKIDDIEEKLKTHYKARRNKLEKEAISKIKRNPSAFYTYAKKFAKSFSGIGPLTKENGEQITDPLETAEALKVQYEKVFSKPDENMKVKDPKEFFKECNRNINIDNVFFTEQDVRDAINHLSNKAAAGPDGIPAQLLKKCRDSLSLPLTILWQKSLSTGDIPSIFKTAFVTPIHKSTSPRTKPENYRPVSLTSHLIKTFERVLKKSLQNYLEVTLALEDGQHGFRPKRSCLTQMLSHYDTVLRGLEEGHNVDSVYLDFAKAFDKVDLGILAHKMKEMGVFGPLAVWLFNFLSSRTQVVLANGARSSASSVASGVPQGTVLGPILFLIMINDLGKSVLNSFISMFADDTRVSKVIEEEEDVKKLQDDLDRIYEWQSRNNMLFNTSKFELLRYGVNENLKISGYTKPGSTEEIAVKSVLRDLGVQMNEKADFSDHINKVVTQVSQKAGWILRTFATRSTTFMRLMWKTLLQAHIDYCSQLYQPLQSGNLTRIENLMKTYTKKIPQIKEQNYWMRLKTLKMNSQQRRFERYRILYTWKVLEGLVPNPGLEQCDPGRGGRQVKIQKLNKNSSAKTKSLREASFQVHGARLFNCLPEQVRKVTKCELKVFKEKLDTFLSRIPDEPKIGSLIPACCDQVTGAPSNSLVDQVRLHLREGRGGRNVGS